jgi:hypothetical protein
MPKPRVRRVQEVDVNKLEFSEIADNSFGGKLVYIKYVNEQGEREDLNLQTPKMHNSWGVHTSQARDPVTKAPAGDPRYYLQLSFGKDPKNSTLKLHNLLNAIDQRVLEEARKNCVSWLKIKTSQVKVIDEKYRPQIQFSVDENMDRDNKYPDSVRYKIPFDNETKQFYNTVEVYDENGTLQSTQTIDDMQRWLTKGSNAIAIVQLSSIYFAGGNFGLSWKVVQVQSFPCDTTMKGFQIQNEDDEAKPAMALNDSGDEEQ